MPLPDHAITEVVENDDLDREPVGSRGFKLADVHAHAAVAVDVDNEAIRFGNLGADGGRQSKPHRPHASGSQPEPWLAEIEVLSGPHLVLTDTCRDDCLAACQPVDFLNHGVGLYEVAFPIVVETVFLFEAGYLFVPDTEILFKPDALAICEQVIEVPL